MLFKGFQIAKTAVFVEEGVLVELVLSCLAGEARERDELDVDLASLTGIVHLLVRFGDVFGIRQLHRHLSAACQDTVQAGDGTGVPSSPQLHPKHDEPGVGISSPHILNERQFFFGVLIGVVMRSVRSVRKGLQSPIVALHPTVDVLSVCSVPFRRLGDAVLPGIQN